MAYCIRIWQHPGGVFSAIGISINALIIIISAFFAIRYARQRNINLHNQLAVHLLLGMSGVWLFRIFFMLWMTIHRAPVGFDPETFTGPFLNALAVFVYILPQAIVVLYFKAKFSASVYKKWALSLLLFVITIGIAIGTIGAVTASSLDLGWHSSYRVRPRVDGARMDKTGRNPDEVFKNEV